MLSLFWIVVTALLWGVTDPLLKRFGEGIASDSVFNLTTNSWRYALAFLANQVWSPNRHLKIFIYVLSNSAVIAPDPSYKKSAKKIKRTEWPTQIIPIW